MSNETSIEYSPSPELLKLQKKLVEMLRILVDICDRHNLTYYLMHGALIGAIRHNGHMIPWDDDIDIAMPRESIKRLMKICKKELPENYFLQYEFNDKYYDNGFLRLRDKNTTAICTYEWDLLLNEKNRLCNMGIFIDIYPMDNIPDNKVELNAFKKKNTLFGNFKIFVSCKKISV